jgi:hypothetical protein
MTKESKKKEGENNKKQEERTEAEKETARVNLTADSSKGEDGEDQFEQENKTLSEIEEENTKDKKIKNLISVVVILTGLFAGSLFVDVVQFITKSGYSESALRETNLFELGDKTWVAYQEPAVKAQVLISEKENCPECDPQKVLEWMKNFMPTISVDKVLASSEEGKKIIEKYELKTVPSFVFDKKLDQTDFFKEGQLSQVFEEKKGSYLMNSASLGVPVGEYLKNPEVKEGDPVLGKEDAQAQAVVFSDFQCPYSKEFYNVVKEVLNENEEISFVYKDMPLERMHSQSKNAAMAGRCAADQQKFKEMADLLFENQEEWSQEEGKEIFKSYASGMDLNQEEFNTCLEESRFKSEIEKSLETAVSFGVSGTPAIFVEGEFLNGVTKKEKLLEIINEEVAKD